MTRDVASQRQLFIDDLFIAEMRDVKRAVNRPSVEAPVIEPGPEGTYNDGFVGCFGTVAEDEGIFKGWIGGRSAAVMSGRQKGTFPLGYFTSTDGQHWDAPTLGLVEWNGSADNNICHRHGGYVFKDPRPRRDSQRYKLLSTASDDTQDQPAGGLCFHVSPDGLHWTRHPQNVLALHPDCFNQVLYDPRIGRYVAYLRCWPGPGRYGYGRAVCRLEVDDLLDPWPHPTIDNPRHFWGKDRAAVPSREFPVVMEYPGWDQPGHCTDIYDPHVVIYPWADGVYLAFPELNHHMPDSPIKNHSTVEVGMCVSRDGVRWDWPSLDAYVPLGPKGQGRGGMLYNITGMLRRGEEILQYHFASEIRHGEGPAVHDYQAQLNSGRIFMTRQRLDGFVSMDFGPDGGELLTAPLNFRGDRLVLNVASAGGTVEVCDQAGLPLPGLSAENCRTVNGDSTSYAVTWDGGDLARHQGGPVRLRMRLRNAKLYAFQFCQQ